MNYWTRMLRESLRLYFFTADGCLPGRQRRNRKSWFGLSPPAVPKVRCPIKDRTALKSASELTDRLTGQQFLINLGDDSGGVSG